MIVYKQKEYGIGGVLGSGLENTGGGIGAAVKGIGQLGASGLAAASIGLKKAALWGAAHPLVLGGLGALALWKILKRRRERKMQERGYSVVERVFSCVPKDKLRVNRVVDAAKRLNPNEKGIKVEKLMRLKKFSDSPEYIDPNEPYVPKGPREAVPKKIVKKAKKSGVIQKDSEGNWRIINMNAPGGPVFWRNKYSSKEACQRVLDAYHSGAWNNKK